MEPVLPVWTRFALAGLRCPSALIAIGNIIINNNNNNIINNNNNNNLLITAIIISETAILRMKVPA